MERTTMQLSDWFTVVTILVALKKQLSGIALRVEAVQKSDDSCY